MATLSVKRGRGGPGASAGAARDVSAKKQAREECVMVIVHAPPPDVSDERRKVGTTQNDNGRVFFETRFLARSCCHSPAEHGLCVESLLHWLQQLLHHQRRWRHCQPAARRCSFFGGLCLCRLWLLGGRRVSVRGCHVRMQSVRRRSEIVD